MMIENKVPYCHSCGHHHEQGVKCAICGHVGKSQIFSKMRSKAEEKKSFRCQSFPLSLLAMHRPLRDLVEGLLPLNEAEHVGMDCRGTLLFKGDMVVGAATFDVVPDTTSSSSAVNKVVHLCINTICILEPYQRQGHAWKLLLDIFRLAGRDNGSILSTILLFVPSSSWIEGKVEALGFQPVNTLPPFSFRSTERGRWLGWKIAEGGGHQDQIELYLQAQQARYPSSH